ncbi:ScyD/ScyE family protein [Ammonicoccus fulvus]|uniref:ScyD/ScyE family protein n=1 Tax=Ammonicoccus fulvus TaxID=3138240 RepID=A0ABZ3FRS2_9ACTN
MSRRTKALLAATSAVALTATTLAAAPAAYADNPSTTVVASGLNNPRQISFGAGQTLYVAESGTGGSGPCLPNPEDSSDQVCLGATGSITEISRGEQKRIVTGLPSLASAEGGGASGPADVDVRGNTITIAVGLGGTTESRAQLGAGGAQLGTLLTGRIGSSLSVAADVAAYEQAHDPDGAGPDSNPTGFIALDSHNWAVIDAGGNDLIKVGKRGESTVAVFPGDRTAPAPFAGPWGDAGTPLPYQSVPTDVVKGPDGAFYVSELTGFPFPKGASTIWKVVPGQAPTVYATGLTNVTSLDFKGNQLYAVQLADNGFLAGPIGSVRKVVPGSTDHPVVVGGLQMPYGIAIRGNDAYITTGAMLSGGGEVHRISLR